MIRYRASFSLAIFVGAWAAAAQAQQALPSRIVLPHGVSPAFAMMQARAVAKAAQIRQAWQSAGHSGQDAYVAPEILAGKIDTPAVDVDRPPATVKTTVSYKTGAAGLSDIQLVYYSSASDQTYDSDYGPNYYGAASTHGSATFTDYSYPFNLYAAPGNWTLGYAYIFDKAGNYTYYDGSQLAALFPSTIVTVTSRYPDTVNPTVSAGQVLTPTVSESAKNPVLKVSLKAADSGSGVVGAFALVEPPGEDYGYEVYGYTPAPAASATIEGYLYLPGQPTGTWTIYGFGACDAADNCYYDYNSADVQALFGTTSFTVTN